MSLASKKKKNEEDNKRSEKIQTETSIDNYGLSVFHSRLEDYLCIVR